MKLDAEKTIILLKNLLEHNLSELQEQPYNDFIYGEMTAYVECLEFLQHWDKSEKYELDYDIEEKFPL